MGVRDKVQRAWEHRYALEAEVEPVITGEAHQIQMSAKLDPDSGYHVFRVSVMPDGWQRRTAVILGDVVHNLRSALDQLAYQLVLNHYGRPPTEELRRLVKFPIEQKRSSVTSSYTYSKVSPSCRADIAWAQPYDAANRPTTFRYIPALHALAVLQRLSNRDKHRMLNPILVSTSFITFKGGELDGVPWSEVAFDYSPRLGRQNLKIGTELMRCDLPSYVNNEVEVAAYAAPDVRLPQGRYSLIHGIDLMTNAVERVIDRFATRYRV